MSGSLRRVFALARPPRGRLALSTLLGALAVVFGIGLMTSAGYLIARAAEQPAILSLTTLIVAVRFFGLARPIARYLERLASHDLAFRVLARIRVRFYERIEPLAPAELDAYRSGDLVSRMVADVDALQSLYLRGLGPPIVAVLAGALAVGVAFAVLPLAALLLMGGLLVAGVGVPIVSGLLGRETGRFRSAVQGHLAAELVDIVRGASELVVYGREEGVDPPPTRDRRDAGAAGPRDALASGVADGLGIVVAGATTAAVLAVAVSAQARAISTVYSSRLWSSSRSRRSRRSRHCRWQLVSSPRRLPPAGVCSSSRIVSRWSRILPRQSRHRGARLRSRSRA